MVSRHGLTEWVQGLSPLQAILLAVIGCFLVPGAIMIAIVAIVLASPDPIAPEVLETKLSFAYAPVMAPIWLGYPVTVSIHLQRALGECTRVKAPLVIVCLICAMAAYLSAVAAIFLAPTEAWDGEGIGSIGAFELVLWYFGFVCSLYIIWIAARGLVLAEERCNLSSVPMTVTFGLFFVLPLGVYSLQRRLHSLVPPGATDVPGA